MNIFLNQKVRLTMVVSLVFLLMVSGVVTEKPNMVIAAGNTTFYVATDGDDSNPGTLADPFKTIEKARQVVEAYIANGMTEDVVVMIRGGNYYLDSSLVFDEDDSGRDGYNVIYQNYPGEEPVIIGGKEITGWTLDSGNVYKAYLSDVDNDTWEFDQLFVDGERQVMARYPNSGYINTDKTAMELREFHYQDNDLPSTWDYTNAQIYIWGISNCFTDTVEIQSIDHTERKVTLVDDTINKVMIPGDSRYFIQGVKDALDSTGEFYLNKQTGYLYYWPEGGSISGKTVVAPVLENVIELIGSSKANVVENIQFEGLSIWGSKFSNYFTEVDDIWNYPADANINGAIYLENAEYNTIKNCKIYNAGFSGVTLNFYSKYNTVYGNEIFDNGYHGVLVRGTELGTMDNNNPAYDNVYNTISNNYIHDCGELVGHGGGIFIARSSENEISYNIIRDMPRYGICMKGPSYRWCYDKNEELGGSWDAWEFMNNRNNVFEYNDIAGVNSDSSDSGAISFWGTGANTVNNNIIHDLERDFGWSQGIYFDDFTNKSTITNNIIYENNAGEENTFLYLKGIYEEVENNIFIGEVDNNYGIVNQWFLDNIYNPTSWHTYRQNIFYFKGSNDGYYYFKKGYENDRIYESDYNLFYQATGTFNMNGVFGDDTKVTWNSINNQKYDQHSIYTDPKFVDIDSNDYRLKYDSPAYSLNFEDINVSQVGAKSDFPFTVESVLDKVYITNNSNDVWRLELGLSESTQINLVGRTANRFNVDLSSASISYTSDNTSVATVNSSGLISSVAQGTAKITASVTLSGVTKTCDVTVIVDDSIDSIYFEDVSLEIPITNSKHLPLMCSTELGFDHYIDQENITVTYSSSNENVVKILDVQETLELDRHPYHKDNGDEKTVTRKNIVVPQGVGTATITATANINGTNMQDTILVTVISGDDTFDDIGTSKTYYSIQTDDSTFGSVTVEDISAIIRDDFNKELLVGLPNNFTDITEDTTYGNASLQYMPGSSTDKGILLIDKATTGDGPILYKVIDNQNDNFTVAYKVYPEQTDNAHSVYLMDRSSGICATKVALSGSGQIRYYKNDGTNSYTSIGTYTANTELTIKLDVDVANDTYDIYVDDVLKATGLSFYNRSLDGQTQYDLDAIIEIDSIRFQSEGGVGNVYIDDVNMVTKTHQTHATKKIGEFPGGYIDKTTDSAHGSVLTQYYQSSETDKAIEIKDDATGDNGPKFEKKFSMAQEGDLLIEYTLYPEQTNNAHFAYLMDSSSGICATKVALSGNGQIRYYKNDGTNSYTSIGTYTADTELTIKLDVDIANDTYDIYVDDVLKASGLSFYNRSLDAQTQYALDSVTSLDILRLQSVGGAGSVYFDDLVIISEFNYDFDEYSIVSTPTGYDDVTVNSSDGNVTTSYMPKDSTDIAIRFLDEATGDSGPRLEREFVEQDDNFEITYTLYPEQTNNAYYTYLMDSVSGICATKVGLSGNGQIRYYRNDGTNSYTSIGTYTADTAVTIKLDVDIANDTYDIYVNGVSEGTGLSFYNRSLDGQTQYALDAVSKLNFIRFESRSGDGTIYLDDIIADDLSYSSPFEQVLMLKDVNPNGGNGISVLRDFDSQSGDPVIEISIRPHQTDATMFIKLRDDDIEGVKVNFAADGNIRYYTSKSAYVNLQSYTSNELYKLKIVIDTSASTYDFYVDDVLKASGKDFAEDSAEKINNLFIQTWTGAGTYVIDGIDIQP